MLIVGPCCLSVCAGPLYTSPWSRLAWLMCVLSRAHLVSRDALAYNLLLHGAGLLLMIFRLLIACPCCLSPAGRQSTYPWSRLACDDVIFIVDPCCLSGRTGLGSISPWSRLGRDDVCFWSWAHVVSRDTLACSLLLHGADLLATMLFC